MSDDRLATAKAYMQEEIEALSEHDRSIVEKFVDKDRIVRHATKEYEAKLGFGQRIADGVAATMGSWHFILIQSGILAIWIALNVTGLVMKWDPYPFILLNLVLSFQAAYAAPIIMMSQNRQAEKDRFQSTSDYEINTKAELEVVQLHAKLDDLREQKWEALVALQRKQIEILETLLASSVKANPDAT